MNEFESRYYPLKRAFDLRSEKFHRADNVRTEVITTDIDKTVPMFNK